MNSGIVEKNDSTTLLFRPRTSSGDPPTPARSPDSRTQPGRIVSLAGSARGDDDRLVGGGRGGVGAGAVAVAEREPHPGVVGHRVGQTRNCLRPVSASVGGVDRARRRITVSGGFAVGGCASLAVDVITGMLSDRGPAPRQMKHLITAERNQCRRCRLSRRFAEHGRRGHRPTVGCPRTIEVVTAADQPPIWSRLRRDPNPCPTEQNPRGRRHVQAGG